MTSIFDQHLPRNEANFAALSPLSFIERTAEVYPDRLAIVHGALRQTWAQAYARCRQLASALTQAGRWWRRAKRPAPWRTCLSKWQIFTSKKWTTTTSTWPMPSSLF